jgi:DNA ligase D-like protein (predicted ligase)
MKATFIEPMLLLKTDALPDEAERWEYELKLDGFRTVGFKTDGRVHLRSRNDNDFSQRYAAVSKALDALPGETVVDGEIVAVDSEGRPSFTLLQNHGGAGAPILFYIFDVMVLAGKDLMREPLDARRDLLERKVLPRLAEPVRHASTLDATLPVLIESVRQHGLEGLVAKRRDSRYEPGVRSGAWRKMRVNRAQTFVIGGYTVGTNTFDALICGAWQDDKLMYVARTRSGFTPAVRSQLFARFHSLETQQCPFANLPEAKSGRWGQGLTAAKMNDCRWLKPVLTAELEFLERTGEGHLRHSSFVRLV